MESTNMSNTNYSQKLISNIASVLAKKDKFYGKTQNLSQEGSVILFLKFP